MRSFSRALVSTLAFFLCAILLGALVCLPLLTGHSGYSDAARRDALAGQLDLLISGASHGTNAFVPDLLDEALGTRSYNLSGFRASLKGRYALLEQELARNPVKTVVLEISSDCFTRDPAAEKGKGEAMTIARLSGWKNKLRYMRQTLSFFNGDYDNVCCMLLGYGIHGWLGMLTGSTDGAAESRGWWAFPASDVSMDPSELPAPEEMDTLQNTWYPELTEEFADILRLCRAEGAEVLVVVTPLPESSLLRNEGWDVFREKLASLCAENGCPLLDFNLKKDREAWLSDKTGFQDGSHLSAAGAAAFSRVFAETLSSMKTEDVRPLFYDSYAEALAHFSLMSNA